MLTSYQSFWVLQQSPAGAGQRTVRYLNQLSCQKKLLCGEQRKLDHGWKLKAKYELMINQLIELRDITN